jgi:ubiquitin carboxyl-terminal hydrolase 12/46
MGEMTKSINCHNCRKVYYSLPQDNVIREPFLELQVDIKENSSLQNCIREMLKGEELKDDCKFDCNFCKERSNATATYHLLTRMSLSKLPEILIVQLKRFKYDEKNNQIKKLDCHTPFSQFIRLKVVRGGDT